MQNKKHKKEVNKVAKLTAHDVSKDKIIAILEHNNNNGYQQQSNGNDPIYSHSSATLEELCQIASQNQN